MTRPKAPPIESLQRRDLDVVYGRPDVLTPGIRRVVAENPGPFTFRGTGTYVLGHGEVAVIDPGPDDGKHLDALLAAIAGERVTHILVTHTHSDHSPGARALQARTGAVVYGFGPHPVDDEPVASIAEADPSPEGAAGATTDANGSSGAHPADADADPTTPKRTEEGGDREFVPDVTVSDGEIVRGAGWTVECVHTPGHISNHVCYAYREEDVLFSGDHVMGWSTSVISPPAGDMAAYFASLHKLLPRRETTYWPTHGPSIPEPVAYVESLIEHRRGRERAILERLSAGSTRIPDIVAALYTGLDEKLVKAAGRSVLAHLRQLAAEGRVDWEHAPDLDPPTRTDGSVIDRPMVESVFRTIR